MKPILIISPDYVMFDGQRITRQKRYSVAQWLEFWEKVKRLDEPSEDVPLLQGYLSR